MIVKAIYKDETHNYFRDKTTAPEIENQVKRVFGDIFECDDELANERIEKGLVKKANKKEEKEYLDSITTNDEANSKGEKEPDTDIDDETNLEEDKNNE